MTLPNPQPPDLYPVNPDSSYSHFQTEQYVPENITATLPVVVTLTGHPFVNGNVLRTTQFITIPFARATGMEQLNNRQFTVQQCTADTFQLYDSSGYPVDGRGYTTYVQGGQFTLVGQSLNIQNPTYPPPPGVPDPFT